MKSVSRKPQPPKPEEVATYENESFELDELSLTKIKYLRAVNEKRHTMSESMEIQKRMFEKEINYLSRDQHYLKRDYEHTEAEIVGLLDQITMESLDIPWSALSKTHIVNLDTGCIEPKPEEVDGTR